MYHLKFHGLIFLIVLLVACKKNPVATNTISGGVCDTLHVTYSGKVKPILTANCYGCHSNATASTNGGIDLENFVELKNYMDLRYHSDTTYGSQFYNICNQTFGSKAMPPSYKMNTCEIRSIKIWIDAGALNN